MNIGYLLTTLVYFNSRITSGIYKYIIKLGINLTEHKDVVEVNLTVYT